MGIFDGAVLRFVVDNFLLIVQALPCQHYVVLRAVDHVVHREQTHVGTGLYVNLNLTLVAIRATFLGGDNDDTVGTTATIQRSSCCVFQNGGRSDIARVNRADRTGIQRNTIYYVERSAVGGDGTDTTNTDVGYRTRLTARGNHLNTGTLARQSLGNIRRILLLDILCFYGLYRTGKASLADVTVTGNNDLLNHLAVLGHRDLEVLAGSYLLGSHTYITDNQSLHRLRYLHLELTVVIRDRTLCGTLCLNAGANHRLPILIDYHTAYLFLREQPNAHRGKKHKCKNLLHCLL